MTSLARTLDDAARLVIGLALGAMVAAAVVQVASRYVFNSPLGWTEELAKLLMVWWTFLAVGVLAFKGRLLAIDAFLLALGPRAAHGVIAFGQVLSAVVIAFLAWLGVRLVDLAGTQITPALDIPYAYIYASLPIGMAIAALGFAVRAIVHTRVALSRDAAHPISALERTDA